MNLVPYKLFICDAHSGPLLNEENSSSRNLDARFDTQSVNDDFYLHKTQMIRWLMVYISTNHHNFYLN